MNSGGLAGRTTVFHEVVMTLSCADRMAEFMLCLRDPECRRRRKARLAALHSLQAASSASAEEPYYARRLDVNLVARQSK